MAPKNEQDVFLNHGMQCFMMFCVWEIMIDPILVDESPMDGCEINQTFTTSPAKPWETVECQEDYVCIIQKKQNEARTPNMTDQSIEVSCKSPKWMR